MDDLARGQASFQFGDYQDTIDSLTRYTTQHPLVDIPAQLYLLLGQAYREIGNWAAAITAFQTIIDQYPTDRLFGQALLETAQFLSRAGRPLGTVHPPPEQPPPGSLRRRSR